MKYTVFTILAVGAIIAACVKPPYQEMKMQDYQPVEAAQNQRVSVTRLGVFEDDLAYSDKRGVYLIVDQETGKEFIGVSGIGIAEVGSHSSGKARYEDER